MSTLGAKTVPATGRLRDRWQTSSPSVFAIVLLATTSLAALGCSGNAGGAPLSEFPAREAQAQCQRVFRCCTVAQIQRIYGSTVTDETVCIQKLTPVADFLATQITDSQSAGRIRYNGATADACFRKLASAACTPASNDQSVVPECKSYLEPQVATGGACGSDQECLTGFCSRAAVGTSDGICGVAPTKGMSCVNRCAAGTYCETVTTICVDPKADGAFCLTDDECRSGNCANPSLTSGTCGPAPASTCGPGA